MRGGGGPGEGVGGSCGRRLGGERGPDVRDEQLPDARPAGGGAGALGGEMDLFAFAMLGDVGLAAEQVGVPGGCGRGRAGAAAAEWARALPPASARRPYASTS